MLEKSQIYHIVGEVVVILGVIYYFNKENQLVSGTPSPSDITYIWTSVGINREYGLYAIDGAIEGKKYGLTYSDDNHMLLKINDYSWLKDRFEEKYAY